MNSKKGRVKRKPVRGGDGKGGEGDYQFVGKTVILEREVSLDGPTQHSIIKSRVSFAQATSLGRSSVYATYYICVCVRACACVRVVARLKQRVEIAAYFLSGSWTFKGRRRAQRRRTNL